MIIDCNLGNHLLFYLNHKNNDNNVSKNKIQVENY